MRLKPRCAVFRGLLQYSALVSIMGSSSAWALDANVKGVDSVLTANVDAYLATLDIPEGASPQQYENVIHQDVVDALKAYGYYSPDIQIRYSNTNHVNIQIEHGARVHVNVLEVNILGEAQHDDTIAKAVKRSALVKDKDKPLLHEHYEALKTQLNTLALQRGYFDAQYKVHRIEVRPWENRADIYLTWDSGRRYHFGDISYTGSQIHQQKLEAMLPFKPGDPYSSDALAEYNSRLGDSGWFRSTSVIPQLSQQSSEQTDAMPVSPSPDDSTLGNSSAQAQAAPAIAPVHVDLIPADRHRFDTGIGYSTDIGPNLQFSWLRPWLNSRGDSWSDRLFLSGPKSKLAGQYKIPLANPLHDEVDLNYGFEYIDNNDTRSRETYFTPTRVWHFTNGWNQQLYVRFSKDDFTQADQSADVFLITPGIAWNRKAVDNEQFPMHGNRQDFMIEGASSSLGSDITFVRSAFTTRWVESIGHNNRFYLRGNVATIKTNDFDQMPPTLRYFAGGDNSVRGYGYEDLAPRNSKGDLLGGKNMLTGTLEYQRRVTGQWWGAIFYDAGNAFNSWGDQSLYRAAGVGIRWISPVGPIRFDVAHPYDEDSSYRINFAIGPEF